MEWIDTHVHIYLPEFEEDRDEVVAQASDCGVKQLLMPNVDGRTIGPLMEAASNYPGICLPMMALHPTSVKDDYEEAMIEAEQWLAKGGFVAVGETGIDLYWDKTHFEQQVIAFRRHAELSLQYDLPLVIHSRNALNEIFDVVEEFRGSRLRGVFHCFPGDLKQAERAIELGFLLGIGGVVTYKNSTMARVVEHVRLQHILLETDAPYLAPVPYRGKRNQSSFIPLIGRKVAELTGNTLAQTAEITTQNAKALFGLD
jgi:TatD DNase family protein